MVSTKVGSIFSYSLTRPYPYRWFTWAVFIGGAGCTVLFSFVALAANGYNLDIEYTLDLNGTLGADYWFQNAPFSWVSQTKVSCQPALLTVGSRYFTTNLGLTYTLDGLWREGSDGIENRVLPATSYQNTQLDNCEVRQILIDFMRRDETQFPHNWWSWGLTTASATVTCAFETSSGPVKANLTTELPEVRYRELIQSAVLSANVSEHANMWFGIQFTYLWYEQLTLALGFAAPYGDLTTNTGTVILYRNSIVDDYASLGFFYCSAIFLTNGGAIFWMHANETIAGWADPEVNARYQLPNISTTVDTFAKTFYSLVLSDFGVVDKTNALITPEGVEWLGSQIDRDLENNSNGTEGRPDDVQNVLNAGASGYPIEESYQSVVSAMGRLPDLNSTISPTIFAQYLCSIPQQKSGGALIFAVLLADLVFLQAVWTLLNLVTTWWLQRKNKHANYCEGCTNSRAPPNKRKHSDYELLEVSPKDNSSTALPDSERFASGVQTRFKAGERA